MVAEFENAAFSGAKGAVVGPVRTEFGWHLILIKDTK
jgi:parvulin-like peptidyl-prolyl isomerase